MNSGNEIISIYDMYVMNDSGIPIFAGCTVSDYCMAHSDQHPLHTGFISAIQSFGMEVFSGEIQKLSFPKIKVNFKSVGKYSMVFVNPTNIDDDELNKKIETAAEIFSNKYIDQISDFYMSDELFNQFNQDMYDIGLIPQNRLQSTKAYFITKEEEPEKKSKNLVERFKQKFNSLLK